MLLLITFVHRRKTLSRSLPGTRCRTRRVIVVYWGQVVVSQLVKNTKPNGRQKNNQTEMGRTQSGQSNRRNRLSRKSYQRGVNNNLAQTGLQSISYRIRAQEHSDGEQEEMNTLNTFPERGGCRSPHTHKRETPWLHLPQRIIRGWRDTCTHTS